MTIQAPGQPRKQKKRTDACVFVCGNEPVPMLEAADVPGDGACLFSAIGALYTSFHPTPGALTNDMTMSLRRVVADQVHAS